jgi:hypothetical protein
MFDFGEYTLNPPATSHSSFHDDCIIFTVLLLNTLVENLYLTNFSDHSSFMTLNDCFG